MGESTTTGGDTGLSEDEIMRIHDAVAASLGQGLATGYSVAIWRDGEVIYAEGFGTKDAAQNPVTPDTVFQIGSDTKKLAAIAVLQQVDAGTVSLDDSVGELLGDLELVPSPGHMGALTVREMLSHRSGLFDYTPWSDLPDDAMLAATVEGTFALNEYAMMPPGIAFNYSNPNFALAGRVAEVLTTRPWADVVIEDIAMPLGMTQTWARRADMLANRDDVASGVGPIFPGGIDTFDLWELFTLAPQGVDWVTPDAQDDHAFTRPAGLVWSTASDMARLGGFVIDGDPAVLSAASHDVFRTPVAPMYPGLDPATLGYGYGLITQRGFFGEDDAFYDVTLLTHGGNTLTMTSATGMLPEQRVSVSVLANGYGEDASPVLFAALEVAAELPAPSEPTPLLQPPRADLSVYAGTFSERALGEMTLAFDGADLLVDIPALTMAGYDVAPALVPAARDVFLLDLEGSLIDISFYDGELPFEFGVNRSFVFGRTDAPVAKPLPEPELVDAWVCRVLESRPLELPRLRR
jgi:CubicO group peptidase (beta-lactamase class C family)